MTTRLRRIGVCAAAVGVLAAVVPGTALATPVITMSGSTSVAPLATLLAKAYVKSHPGKVKFKPANKRHGLVNRPKQMKRQSRRDEVMFEGDAKKVIRFFLPNGL